MHEISSEYICLPKRRYSDNTVATPTYTDDSGNGHTTTEKRHFTVPQRRHHLSQTARIARVTLSTAPARLPALH